MPPTAADLEQGMQMLGLMGPMLFQGLTSESTTMVSVDEPSYIVGQSTSSVGISPACCRWLP